MKRSLFLLVAILLGFSPACAGTGLFIVGGYADLDIARESRVEGSYLEGSQAVPPRSDVLIVGGPQAQGGVDEAAEKKLVEKGCRVMRIDGGASDETRALLEEFRRLQETLPPNDDIFGDVAGTLARLRRSELTNVLSNSTPPQGPEGRNLDPRTRTRSFLPPVPQGE